MSSVAGSASSKEKKKESSDALKLEKQKVKVLKKALQEERQTKIACEK